MLSSGKLHPSIPIKCASGSACLPKGFRGAFLYDDHKLDAVAGVCARACVSVSVCVCLVCVVVALCARTKSERMSRVWLGWGRSVWTRHMRMDETYVYGWGIRVWMGHTCMDGAYVYGWGIRVWMGHESPAPW